MILKPMNVGEILDNSFTLLKEQFKSYMAIGAIGMGAFLVLGGLAIIMFYLLSQRVGILGGFIPFIPIIVIYLAILCGLTQKASEQILGRQMSCMETYRFGFGKVGPFLLAGLLVFFAVSLGLLFLVIPGIYVAILFVFVKQSVVIEGKGPWSALQRSKELVKGSWWRCFGILILINVLVSILAKIFTVPLALLAGWLFGRDYVEPVNTFLTFPISCLLTPFSVIAATLLYYDLRIRKENLDVHLMVDHLTEQSGGSSLPGE